jgi:hypothetical protein
MVLSSPSYYSPQALDSSTSPINYSMTYSPQALDSSTSPINYSVLSGLLYILREVMDEVSTTLKTKLAPQLYQVLVGALYSAQQQLLSADVNEGKLEGDEEENEGNDNDMDEMDTENDAEDNGEENGDNATTDGETTDGGDDVDEDADAIVDIESHNRDILNVMRLTLDCIADIVVAVIETTGERVEANRNKEDENGNNKNAKNGNNKNSAKCNAYFTSSFKNMLEIVYQLCGSSAPTGELRKKAQHVFMSGLKTAYELDHQVELKEIVQWKTENSEKNTLSDGDVDRFVIESNSKRTAGSSLNYSLAALFSQCCGEEMKREIQNLFSQMLGNVSTGPKSGKKGGKKDGKRGEQPKMSLGHLIPFIKEASRYIGAVKHLQEICKDNLAKQFCILKLE